MDLPLVIILGALCASLLLTPILITVSIIKAFVETVTLIKSWNERR